MNILVIKYILNDTVGSGSYVNEVDYVKYYVINTKNWKNSL